MKRIRFVLCVLLCLTALPAFSDATKPPVRVAIVGLVHNHVRGFLPRALANPEVQVVGIVESDQQLVAQNAGLYKLSTNLFCASLEELLAKTNVQAVATFTSTFAHRQNHPVEAAHRQSWRALCSRHDCRSLRSQK